MVHRRLVYIYLLNVPSFSSRYFNKIKRASRLGRLLALSLEILPTSITCQKSARQAYRFVKSPSFFKSEQWILYLAPIDISVT